MRYRLLGKIKKTAPYLLQTGMHRVQDTCNPGRRRHYPRPTTIQTTALILSESSNEESSDSDATWGWCSDSNDQERAEQVARNQIIVCSCRGPGNQPGVGSGGGPKALGRSSSAGLWSHLWGQREKCQSPYFIFALFALLTSLLIKYSHSHPPYYLRYLRYCQGYAC